MRLIDADKLESGEVFIPTENGGYGYVEVFYKDDVDAAPTVDAEPIKKGYWINVPRPGIQCSECKATIIVEMQYAHYCPNCGAKMEDEIRGWTQLQDYNT